MTDDWNEDDFNEDACEDCGWADDDVAPWSDGSMLCPECTSARIWEEESE